VVGAGSIEGDEDDVGWRYGRGGGPRTSITEKEREEQNAVTGNHEERKRESTTMGRLPESL
jgi:hypothetical protein